MPKYEKGTAGKLIVQDWDVLMSYPDRQVFRILTEPQIAALVSLCEFLSWRTRYTNFPGQDIISAFAAETVYNLTTPIDFCELIEPCLAGLYDAIASVQADVINIQNIVENVQQRQSNNAAQTIETEQSSVPDEICGAALAVVKAMDGVNRKTYEDTENSLIDNIFEFIPQFIEAVPLFGSLPFDELFELANAYFENQYVDYKDDYALIEDRLICDLSCFVQANDNTFVWDVWDDWLVFVGEGFSDVGSPYYGNRAASVFSRYAPAANTFANQIAEFFNRESSLSQYFETLRVVWNEGLLQPSPCIDCDCPEEWEQIFDFTIDEQGFTAPYGSYVSGQGWASGEIESGLYYTAISISRNVGTSIRYLKVEYDMSGVTGVPQTDRIWVNIDSAPNYLDSATNADGDGRILEWSGADIDITALGFTAAASACVGAFCGGEVVGYRMIVRGFGTNPFI